MIYDAADPRLPVQQGDIFRDLPRIDFSMASVSEFAGAGVQASRPWRAMTPKPTTVVVPVSSVGAVVGTQDCDVATSPEITLFQVRRFVEVQKDAAGATSVDSWISLITQRSRLNLKWFYLPPDPIPGFTERMAVDYRCPIRIRREDLEANLDHRTARLRQVAVEHFREKLADFYRRFAYDEWYPLSKEEFAAYNKKNKGQVVPFDWQRDPNAPVPVVAAEPEASPSIEKKAAK